MDNTDLIARFNQLETPGHNETFAPDEAELLGAFEELALTENDATQGADDLVGHPLES